MNESVRVFIIYSRPECHLCDQMLDALNEWQNRFKFKVKIVNIDEDPALTARFAARIPLLAIGDNEICEHFLDNKALLKFFEDEK